jgi:hypothetical protein
VKATSITSTAPGDGRIDQTTFRRLMSHWATGVGVITCLDDGAPVGELRASGEVVGP